MKRWAIIGAAGAMLVSSALAQSTYLRVDTYIEPGYRYSDHNGSEIILTNTTHDDIGFAVYDSSGTWEADGDIEPDNGSFAFGLSAGTYIVHWTYDQGYDDSTVATVYDGHATRLVVYR